VSETTDDPVGRVLSHYEIRERLGAGGGGEVFVARDTRLDRLVALKLIPAELSADAEGIERFRREARVLAAINHPNIVTIYSVEESDGRHYLTMELVRGKTVTDLIPPGGMPLDQFLGIALPLAQAVAAAHANGITHRDLKPANVMVDDLGRVKVLDFGLARLQQDDDASLPTLSMRTITQPGVLIGTLQYMAPEQLEGRPADPRADVFAIGSMMHEMLTGNRPFTGASAPALISAIFRDDPVPVTDHRPELPRQLATLILGCLEKNPDLRPPDAAPVASELERIAPILPPGPAIDRDVAQQSPGGNARSLQERPHGRTDPRLPEPARVVGTERAPGGPGAPGRRGAAGGWAFSLRRKPLVAILAGLAVLLAAVVGFNRLAAQRAPKRIVVFPFENLGAEEDAYFAAGMAEEITSRLAAVHGLQLISRTTAINYNREGKSMRQIGRELGVGYVLEGSIRWDRPGEGPSRVRVTPQLSRVSDDTQLWSERYERDVTAIFDVQTQIAQEVVQRLNITLQEPERLALGTKPTESLDAHLAYLRGMAHGRGATEEDALLAVQMLEEAVTLDPGFVEAWYRLSRANTYVYAAGIDRSPQRLERAKLAADRALELAPRRPDGHRALGNYYSSALGDHDRALAEYRRVLEMEPADSYALYSVGLIMAEQGRWEEGIDLVRQAVEADPRNGEIVQMLGEIHLRMRHFQDAEDAYDRAIAIFPDDLLAWWRKVDLYWIWDGSPARSRQVLENMPKQVDVETTRLWILQEIYERNWQAALNRVQGCPWDWLEDAPRSWYEYRCLVRLGRPQAARAALDQACAAWEQAARERPEDPGLRGGVGLAYAALGRKEEAIRAGEEALALRSPEADAYMGPYRLIELARILALAGEQERALDLIERLLAMPACFTPGVLRLDPDWERLKGNPRFERLISAGDAGA